MKTPMQEMIEQLKEYYDLELKVSGTKNEPIQTFNTEEK
jgi:hypothetical protein